MIGVVLPEAIIELKDELVYFFFEERTGQEEIRLVTVQLAWGK